MKSEKIHGNILNCWKLRHRPLVKTDQLTVTSNKIQYWLSWLSDFKSHVCALFHSSIKVANLSYLSGVTTRLAMQETNKKLILRFVLVVCMLIAYRLLVVAPYLAYRNESAINYLISISARKWIGVVPQLFLQNTSSHLQKGDIFKNVTFSAMHIVFYSDIWLRYICHPLNTI